MIYIRIQRISYNLIQSLILKEKKEDSIKLDISIRDKTQEKQESGRKFFLFLVECLRKQNKT